MSNTINVWDGTEWKAVGTAFPNALTVDGTYTLTNKTISGSDNTLTDIANSSLTNDSITINGSSVALGDSTTIQTGPTSSSVSSNITMSANNKYFVDTSSVRTLTLPSSSSVGDTIAIYDAAGLAGTNNITIDSNGGKINGTVQDAIMDIDGGVNTLVYTGSTYGWRFL